MSLRYKGRALLGSVGVEKREMDLLGTASASLKADFLKAVPIRRRSAKTGLTRNILMVYFNGDLKSYA